MMMERSCLHYFFFLWCMAWLILVESFKNTDKAYIFFLLILIFLFCMIPNGGGIQYAEETIGTAERTELDSEYEQLAERADCYRQWTERIVSKLEAVIQPNPSLYFHFTLFVIYLLIFSYFYRYEIW